MAVDISEYDFLVNGSSVTKGVYMKKAQFGDGYQHRQREGLNQTKITWTVAFKMLSESDGEVLQGHLANGMVEGVLWTSPEDGVTVTKWLVSDGWSVEYVHPSWVMITTTLERIYEP